MSDEEPRFDIDAAQHGYLRHRAEVLIELAMAPSHMLVSGVKGALQLLERETRDPDEIVAEKINAFDEFLSSEDGTYEEVFDTCKEVGALVFKNFTAQVEETYGIPITEPDETDHAAIPMLNGHRLEIHRQNSGNYFITGRVEN